jgi:pyridoxamine 5'-phosphate oxidase
MDHSQPLRETDVDRDPITQFNTWFEDAKAAEVRQPEAMAVASAGPDGAPSVRMVLLKHVDHEGFVFYTNYDSRKGRELSANRQAALLFYWDPLGRQVRIEGAARPTTREESIAYARSRPRGSQISAIASPQSQPIPSREALEARVAELSERYAEDDPPLGDNWGGFRVTPERIEFWQHRNDRLHDRLLYTRQPDGSWQIERLAP